MTIRERAERLAEQLCVSLGKSMDEVLGASELDTTSERAFLKRKLADWFQAELLAYRAEVLEEAAKVAESMAADVKNEDAGAYDVAAAIRALKEAKNG